WQDNSFTSLGLRIKAQALDSGMAAVGGPIVVSSAANSKTAGDQEKPKVAVLPNGGGAVVVWQGGKVGFQQIYARFLGANGLPLKKSDIRVSAQAKLSQSDPAVVALADGNVVVVWSSFGQDGSMKGVFARRFSSEGVPLGAEFRVNQIVAYNQRSPDVALLADGRFVVAWISELQRGPASVDVYARIFSAAGIATGEEFPVNTSTNNPCANPAVAGSSQGGFAVAWSQKDGGKFASASDPNDPTGVANPFSKPGVQAYSGTARSMISWDVYGRFYSIDGNPISEPTVLNAYTYGDQFAPRLSSSGTNYMAVWTSLAQDGDQREGVFGRWLSANGALQGTELHINTTTVNQQFQPCVISNESDSFLTLWSGFVRRNGFDLFSRTYQLSTP
ncbi:MAG: hypothetical protein H7X97_11360, partial [Opitutaceae bacterium]|nr:hypothetical protein [Verrucomicrobiales bacterium]